MEIVGASESSVKRWKQALKEGGMEALKAKPPSLVSTNASPKTREAPTFHHLADCPVPSSRSRPASRRRVSNSAALPCFLINYCTHGHTLWL